jgi:phage FluMu protein gp41
MLLARSSHGQTAETVQLVPELCHLVGITENMRNRRLIWKEIKQVIKVDGPIKIQAMNSLVERVLTNVKNMDLLKDWEV